MNPTKQPTGSTDQPSPLPEGSFASKESSFTFTPDSSAVSSQPRARFLNYTPAQKEAQREWTYSPAPKTQEKVVTPPSPGSPSSTPAEIEGRPIAPLRAKRQSAEASKEAKNGEKLQNDITFLKEQLQKERARSLALKEDLREEQVTKQQNINEIQRSLQESLTTAERHRKAFEEVQKIANNQKTQVEGFRKEYVSIQRLLERKMAGEKKPDAKVAEQEARIAELQKKNEALEKNKDDAARLAMNPPPAKIEELQSSIEALERRNEDLNVEIDSMRARLEAAEKKLTETTVSYRHAQTVIANNDATIRNLEQQTEGYEKQIKGLQHEVGNRENRIKAKEADLRNGAAEVANLNTLNKQLGQENKRLRAQNEKLDLQARDNYDEIEMLREASRDCQNLEVALAEAQAAFDHLKKDIASLEETNSELKTRLEDYPPFSKTSHTGSNLESELSETDYHDVDETVNFTGLEEVPESEETGEARDGAVSLDVVTNQAVGISLEVTVSQEDVTPQVVITSPEVIVSPEVVITPQVVIAPTQISQTPVVNSSPEIPQPQVVSNSPEAIMSTEIPQPSVVNSSPEVITTPETLQPPAIESSPEVITSPEILQLPEVTQSPATPQSSNITTPSIVILKRHNPFECWMQVYIDLWILLVFWLSIGGGPNVVSSSGRAVRGISTGRLGSSRSNPPFTSPSGTSYFNGLGNVSDNHLGSLLEGELADLPLPAAALRDVASVDHAKPDSDLPDFWLTILAFCFHILFYAVIAICVSNYNTVLQERSLWLGSNEFTRQYLHKFYKVPFKREYSMLHELFGPVKMIDLLQYRVHNWAMISRSLPG